MNEAIEGIVGMMREQGAIYNPPSICIGKVVSVEPIQVKTDNLVLDREDLLISDILLGDYARKVKITLSGDLTGNTSNTSGGSGEASFSSHSHDINSKFDYEAIGEVILEACLSEGDNIALMPTDDMQTYIALFKVV